MKLRSGLLLVGVILLSAGLMSGQAIFTPFTGQQVTNTVFVKLPTITCPSGEPAGPYPPYPPCSPGSRVNVRDLVFSFNVQSTDPRFTGKFVNVFNGNTDGWTLGPPAGPGSGPIWGTLRLEVSPDEVWEGIWTGKRKVTATGAISTIHAIAHGTGGRIEGLQAEFDILALHTSPQQYTGRILEPGGSK